MNQRLLAWVLYAVVGAFLLAAAAVKISDPVTFLSSLLTYELFPYKLAVVLAYFAPVLEATLGVSLVSGALRQGGVLLSAVLLLVFIGLVAQGWLRGLEMDCGCFGENTLSSGTDYLGKLGQNALLLGALAGAWLMDTKAKRKKA